MADITEVKLPPLKEISTLATFDALGQETEEASEIAITVDGAANPKKVTVSKTVDASVPLDLTDTEASVTDKTGTAVFTINDAALSGESFSVKDNVVTETGSLLTVSYGNLKTSDRDGKFNLPAGSSLTTTESGTITLYKDAQGSHVAGLQNGDKVTVTKASLTTTYTAYDGKLVIGYTDGDAKATTKSYTLGSKKSFTATWDGTNINAPLVRAMQA